MAATPAMGLIELSLACGERMVVHRFSVREAVSALFEVKVLARSADPCVKLGEVVGRPAALRIASGYRFARGGERQWAGICHHARAVQAVEHGDGEAALSTYEIGIVPRLWLLTQRSDYRVIQHKSIPQIVGELLERWDVAAEWYVLEHEHPRFPCKVQYGEEDFAFMSRLLEEAGIAYSLSEADGEGAVVVLSDALHRSAPRREQAIDYIAAPSGATEREHVTRVSVEERVRPEGVVDAAVHADEPAVHGVGPVARVSGREDRRAVRRARLIGGRRAGERGG
ncbi:MAG: phage late control D family protein [Polyangiaceae bacterium]|nr:phage late control D family protein [Polyangiaceae bacterium]